ncbi:MAG: hypothetical protein A4E65_02112 [Syntrophorhabdus sp. PtaU1.Bin153]|nr:MAG: hypothetical protein A4E65_02112 [Syntrophorhabdus sp. PtaU1.Bin153]
MKTILSLLIASALILPLTGCGEADKTKETIQQTAKELKDVAKETAKQEASKLADAAKKKLGVKEPGKNGAEKDDEEGDEKK